MANDFERRITVDAPAEEIFGYVSDLERHSEWATNKLTIRLEQPKPIRLGTTFTAEAVIMGRTSTDAGRVTEFQPPVRFAYETQGPAGTVINWFEIRSDGGRCVLTKGSSNTRLSMFSRFMIPMLRFAAPRWYDRNLRTIKERLEARTIEVVERPLASPEASG